MSYSSHELLDDLAQLVHKPKGELAPDMPIVNFAGNQIGVVLRDLQRRRHVPTEQQFHHWTQHPHSIRQVTVNSLLGQ